MEEIRKTFNKIITQIHNYLRSPQSSQNFFQNSAQTPAGLKTILERIEDLQNVLIDHIHETPDPVVKGYLTHLLHTDIPPLIKAVQERMLEMQGAEETKVSGNNLGK